MLKWMRTLIVSGMILVDQIPAVSQEEDARAIAEAFSALRAGMSVDEFLRVRPDVTPDLMDADRQTGLRPDGTQRFLESALDTGGLARMFGGNYHFKSGRLTTADVLWAGSRANMRALWSALSDSCGRTSGQSYSAYVTEEQQMDGTHLRRPVLLWESVDATLSLMYSKQRGNTEGENVLDWVNLLVFSNDSSGLVTFPQVEVSDSARRELFMRDLGIELPTEAGESTSSLEQEGSLPAVSIAAQATPAEGPSPALDTLEEEEPRVLSPPGTERTILDEPGQHNLALFVACGIVGLALILAFFLVRLRRRKSGQQ